MALIATLAVVTSGLTGMPIAQSLLTHRPAVSTSTDHGAPPAAKAGSAFSTSSDGTLLVTGAGLRAVVRRSGLEVRTSATATPVSVTASTIGRRGERSALPQATPVASDSTATAARGPVVEWVHSQDRRLEQGWTIARRPGGSGPLSLQLTVSGADVARTSPTSLSFGSRIAYTGLAVRDARGTAIPAHFAPSPVGARIVVEDARATYPLVIDPDLSPVAAITDPPDAGSSAFGSAIAVKGRWMVIGEPNSRPLGTPTTALGQVDVYFDTSGNGSWSKIQTLTTAGTPYVAPTYATTSGLGSAVGLTLEPAGVTVFARLSSAQAVLAWTLAGDPSTSAGAAAATPTFLQGITATQWLVGGGVGDFGSAFDAEGTMLVAGAPQSGDNGVCTTSPTGPVGFNERIGTAEVFQRSGGFGTTYAYQTHIDPPNGLGTPIATRSIQQWFGGAVAIDPTTNVIAVGARGDGGATPTPSGAACTTTGGVTTWTGAAATAGDTNWTGAVDVFKPAGGNTWTLAQRILSNGQPAQARFGSALTFTGLSDGLLVGAPFEAAGANRSVGASYLFDTDGTTWSQTQRISADDPTTTADESALAGQSAGTAVAASPDGTQLYIGVPGQTQAATASVHQGDVHVYARASGSGTATFLKRLDPQSNSNSHGGIAEGFGTVLAATPSTVAVGAPAFGEDTATLVGRVSAFQVSGTTYTPSAELGPDEHTANDHFGTVIAQDGDMAAIALPNSYRGSGYGIGGVAVYHHSATGWALEQMLFPWAGHQVTNAPLWGWSVALHVTRNAQGADIGLVVAVGAPQDSSLDPDGTGSLAPVAVNNAGTVGIWGRNGPPGTTYTNFKELWAGGQTGTTTSPGDTSQATDTGEFGYSVAFTHDGTLLVGEPGASSGNGRISRFDNVGTSGLTFQGFTNAPVSGSNFGDVIGTDGTTVLVPITWPFGTPGVWRYTDGNATTNLAANGFFPTALTGSFVNVVGGGTANLMGLSISGNRFALSGDPGDGTRQVRVYRMVGNVAVPELTVNGTAAKDTGFSIDLNHGGSVPTLVIGSPALSGTKRGSAEVYVGKLKADGSAQWSRSGSLVVPDPGPTNQDAFGTAVTNWPADGGALIGAPLFSVTSQDGIAVSYDTGTVTPPPGPQAFVDVSAPATMQVGADQLKTAGLPPSLLTKDAATAGSIAAAPIGSIDLSQAPRGTSVTASPMSTIPLSALPMSTIPMSTIPLSDLPLTGVAGGWQALLAGTAFAGVPLQNVTFKQVYDLPSVQALTLGSISFAGTPMSTIPMSTIALGDKALSEIALDASSSASPISQWCSALTAAGADTSALGLDCSHPSAAQNTTVTVLSIGLRGAPMSTIPMSTIPMSTIDLAGTPMSTIPMSTIGISGTPMSTIPMSTINLAGTPMSTIPMSTIPMSTIPMSTIPMSTIQLSGTPMSTIPMSTINLAGTPMSTIPMSTIPMSTIPMSTIPMSTIPMSTIPMSTIDIAGSPMSTIPLSALDLGATPMSTIPMSTIPMSTIPMSTIPMSTIPMSTIPMSTIPMSTITIAGSPMSTIPMSTIDIAATPMSTIPLSHLTDVQLAALVDCHAFDCTASGSTFGDAVAAGALKPGATLGDAAGLLHGVRLSALIGAANAITVDQLKAAIDGLKLSALTGWDDVTLGELAPLWPYLTLGQVQDELHGVRLGDLAAHFVDFTKAQVQKAVANSGAHLSDLTGWDDVTLGELTVLHQYLTLGDLTPALKGIRLGDLVGVIAKPSGGTYSQSDLRAALDQAMPGATLGSITDWDNVTLGELGTYGDTTLGQLLSALTQTEAGKITLGDLLLALINPRQYPWDSLDMSQVDAQALDQTPASTPVHVTYRAAAPDGLPRTVQVTVELPPGSRLDPASFTATWTGRDGEATPAITGDTATWTFTNVPANADQSVSFNLQAPLTIGPTQVRATALIVEDDATATDTANTTVQESFEPNDTIAEAQPLPSDTIMLSHVSHAGDLDVYKFDVTQPGQRISLSLSNLDADLDLVLYAPRSAVTPPGSRSLDPVEDSASSAAPAQQSGSVLQQPTAGNDVQTPTDLGNLAVVQASFNRGRSNEQIDTGVLTRTGTYYVAVSGYNGASDRQPYALRLKRFDPVGTQPACPARHLTLGTLGTQLPDTLPAGTTSVFVVDPSRMAGLYGQSAADQLMGQLNGFVSWTGSHPEAGVTASVLTVDADPAVRQAYQDWDASPCLPSGANGVVSQITRLLNGYRTSDPELKNVVIVGGDDAVPFARVPDRATISNELGYASTFSDAGNALYATFATNSLQTDNVYVDRSPYAFGDRTLYVPDATIGRLVENPTEIGNQLTDFENAGGKLAVNTGLVTGYDFLTDGAQAVAHDASSTYHSVDTHLISDTWTRQDLTSAIATLKPNLLSINAHFDHFRSLPGAGNTTHDESDLFTAAAVRGALDGDLAGSVVFSMGCHSGLSASDLLVGASDARALDFAQAVSSQGGVFVGNTGFGYGDTDTVALSEQLMAGFAQRLDGSMSVGEALLFAKNSYFSGLAAFTPYDEKVLQETTFYGLPFYRLDVANPPLPPDLPLPNVVPDPATGLDSASDHIVPTYVNRTADDGTTYVAAKDSQTGSDELTTVQDRPVEPKVTDEFAMPTGETTHDALVTGLTSVDNPGTDPYVFQPVVDSSGERQDVGVDTAFPTHPVQVNPGLTPDGPSFDVAATTGYFRTTKDDGTGVQRNYHSMDVKTYFTGSDDFTAPTFSHMAAAAHDNTLSVTADVMDDRGGPDRVKRVYLLALVDPRPGVLETWESIDLVRTSGTDEWTGSLPANGQHIEYIVQAVDAAGNVAVTSDKATNFVATSTTGTSQSSALDVEVSGPQGNDGWYVGPATVTATGGDGLSFEIVGEQDPAPYTGPVTISGTGIHTVRVVSEDGQKQTVTVRIDTVGPRALLSSPAGGELVSPTAGLMLAFSCPDAGSGATSCTAKLDGSTPVGNGDVVHPTFGTHTVTVTSGADVAGNAPTVGTVSHSFTVVGPPVVGTLGVTKTQDGTPTTASVAFTGNAGLTYAVKVVWGDGTQTVCTAPPTGCTLTRNGLGGGTFTVAHTYGSAAANSTLTATVTDQLGQSGSASIVVNRATALSATPALLQLLSGKVILKSGAISATLTTSGTGLAGQTLRFTLPDGTLICAATTDSTGFARCPSTLTVTLQMLVAGRYVVTYAGHDLYKGSTTTASLIG